MLNITYFFSESCVDAWIIDLFTEAGWTEQLVSSCAVDYIVA